MENFTLQRRVHWYQTVWGVSLIGFGVLTGAVVVMFVILTGKYIIDIRAGKMVGLEFQGSFTSFDGLKPMSSANIDRNRLEQGDFPYLGSQNAPVTIVEFVDFKCPNCRLAYPIMQQVVQKYGGKVKLIIRHLPFESLHPGTTELAKFAECSREQGKFWGAYAYFFANQTTLPAQWTSDNTRSLSVQLGMDRTQMEACMKSQKVFQAINRDYADALASGARGTPTFFVNGTKIEGVVSLEQWKEILR